jgi:cytosine/adenosine deaminase-related metal-dependent hydrolase
LGDDVEFVELPRRGFIVPGLVDTHYHAPQYVNAGNGLDMPLLEWLETYTFPAETRFKDPSYAARGACAWCTPPSCCMSGVCVRVRIGLICVRSIAVRVWA